jgi:preprotein translocase subunit SecD
MAVDANVLIFERTKEELRRGHSFASAIEDGFIRAWSSIRDSNVSTLISAVLMIWFGSSFVRGFATTLALGVLISMFTAITVTRLFLRIVGPMVATRAPWLFLGYTKKEE